jgi:hypothetical protein
LTPNHFKSCCVVADNSLAGDEEGEQAAAKSAHGMWAAEQSCSHWRDPSTVLSSAQALQRCGPLRPESEQPCLPRPPPRCPRRGRRRASSTSGRTAPKAKVQNKGRATESHSKTDSYCSVWAPSLDLRIDLVDVSFRSRFHGGPRLGFGSAQKENERMGHAHREEIGDSGRR